MNHKEKILKYLEFKEIKPASFYKKCKFSNGFLDSGKAIGSDKLTIVLDNYRDLSLRWLLYNEGDMIISKNNQTNGPQVSYGLQTTPSGTPYFDVDFESGFTFLENNQTTKPTSYINHPFFATSDIVVRNSGQSMAKVIKHGDAIGLKHLPNWQEFLAYGEIYAIVLADDRRLVKIITKGDDTNSFTLISKPSDNKEDEFPPQQIKKFLIRNVFRVEAASCLF